MVSCDLMECELELIEKGSATGQLCAASYFDTLDTHENREFKTRAALRYGRDRRISSVFASAYAAVDLCIAAILSAGSDEPDAVRRSCLRPNMGLLCWGRCKSTDEPITQRCRFISAASATTTASISSLPARRLPPTPISPRAAPPCLPS